MRPGLRLRLGLGRVKVDTRSTSFGIRIGLRCRRSGLRLARLVQSCRCRCYRSRSRCIFELKLRMLRQASFQGEMKLRLGVEVLLDVVQRTECQLLGPVGRVQQPARIQFGRSVAQQLKCTTCIGPIRLEGEYIGHGDGEQVGSEPSRFHTSTCLLDTGSPLLTLRMLVPLTLANDQHPYTNTYFLPFFLNQPQPPTATAISYSYWAAFLSPRRSSPPFF